MKKVTQIVLFFCAVLFVLAACSHSEKSGKRLSKAEKTRLDSLDKPSIVWTRASRKVRS